MSQPTPDTPVIVGVGLHQEQSLDPTQCGEPYELMVRAVQLAGNDAGCPALLPRIESVTVAQGMWEYRNPGKLIADAIGCPSAKSILTGVGVMQLQILSDLCRAIADGDLRVGVVAGGEAKFRDLRSKITQQPVTMTEQPEDTPPPDVSLTSIDPYCSDLEALRGLRQPVEFFALLESALRFHRGLGIEEHRDAIAHLYHEFSEIAARNPHAWRQETVPAEEIRNAAGKNAMLAFPYTKRHASQWNVNQAIAILVCSAATAEELGIDRRRWIYPLAEVQSKHVVYPAQQRSLFSHPGTVMCGDRALALTGLQTKDIIAAELYSCFPSAIQSFAHDLRLEGQCPLTVTGSMAFAGGPFNQFSLEGVGRMVEVLREAKPGGPARRVGIVSNLSGIFSKQACTLFSNEPNPAGYHCEDITDAVAAVDTPVPLDGEYVGPATVVAYTVTYAGDHPSHGIAICDTPRGARTVATSEDKALLERMMREEHCGRVVQVSAEGRFS